MNKQKHKSCFISGPEVTTKFKPLNEFLILFIITSESFIEIDQSKFLENVPEKDKDNKGKECNNNKVFR